MEFTCVKIKDEQYFGHIFQPSRYIHQGEQYYLEKAVQSPKMFPDFPIIGTGEKTTIVLGRLCASLRQVLLGTPKRVSATLHSSPEVFTSNPVWINTYFDTYNGNNQNMTCNDLLKREIYHKLNGNFKRTHGALSLYTSQVDIESLPEWELKAPITA